MLTQLVNDASLGDDLKATAAAQLRMPGVELDARTQEIVTKLAGPPEGYGGYGYGGRYYK